MKLVKPKFEILTPLNGEILWGIERAARTCYKSEGKMAPDRQVDQAFVHRLLDRGHHAMLEFGGMIHVLFIVDRGVSHELVRHRLSSFAQESTRYCNYTTDKLGNHVTFIIPSWLDIPEGEYDFQGVLNLIGPGSEAKMRWLYHMLDSEDCYNTLIESGWSPQEARSALPNSLKTEIHLAANIREWRHIFQQRTSSKAHPQMREVMIPLLNQFKQLIPVLFDDIFEK